MNSEERDPVVPEIVPKPKEEIVPPAKPEEGLFLVEIQEISSSDVPKGEETMVELVSGIRGRMEEMKVATRMNEETFTELTQSPLIAAYSEIIESLCNQQLASLPVKKEWLQVLTDLDVARGRAVLRSLLSMIESGKDQLGCDTDSDDYEDEEEEEAVSKSSDRDEDEEEDEELMKRDDNKMITE